MASYVISAKKAESILALAMFSQTVGSEQRAEMVVAVQAAATNAADTAAVDLVGAYLAPAKPETK